MNATSLSKEYGSVVVTEDNVFIYRCNCGIEFPISNRFQVELEQHWSAHTKLSDLPNEIINQIMRNLEPDDLASLCSVSEKFKYLARRHFEQERKNCGFVTIRDDIEGNVSFDFDTAPNYVKVFSDLIRSVKVFNETNWENVARFIQKNCHKELLKLVLSGVDLLVYISEPFGEIIRDQLDSVVMLQIDNIRFVNLYEFLKHCTSLKIIVLDSEFHVSEDWMEMRYPNLEILVYRSYSITNHIKGSFFQNNPQLKGVFMDQGNASNLSLTETALPFAMLHYDERYAENQANVLEKCLRGKTIKSLDLTVGVYGWSALQTLVPFNNVQGLHFRTYPCRFFEDLISTGRILPNIRRLCFEISGYERPGREHFEKLAKLFPNLHELHITTNVEEPEEIVNMMEAFLEKLLSLGDVYIYGHDKIFNENTLSSLASARSKLLNASPVKIHINQAGAMEAETDLVSIKFMTDKYAACYCHLEKFNIIDNIHVKTMCKIIETLET